MKELLNKHRVVFAVAAVLTIIDASFQLGVAFFMKFITDATIDKNTKLLLRLAVLAIIFFVLQFILYAVTRIVRAKFIQSVISTLREKIFKHLINLQVFDFHQKNSAEYISMISNDVKLIEESYFEKILDLISMGAQLTATIIALIWIHPVIALIAVGLNLLPLMIPGFFSKKMDSKKEEYSDSMKAYTERIKDLFTGFEVIKSFNVEKESINLHGFVNREQEDKRYRFIVIESIMNGLSFSSAFFIMVIVFALAAFYSINGNVELGTMVAVIMLVNYLVVPIVEISYIIGDINSVNTIKSNLTKMLEDNENVVIKSDDIQFNNYIKLENISFYFEKIKVLDSVNMKFEKGKKYAIVGGSGSGKSTLIKLILGYFSEYKGRLQIDENNLKDLSDKNRSKIMSMIHQNVFMFDDTIFNNICLYKDYSNEEVENAIIKSGLKDLIDSLPKGLNTRIVDNGKNFSGGEKQRFAIARAIIKETELLLIDEATSSLDIETSLDIEKSILKLNEVTTIFVTHRLQESILKLYDEIIVIESGRIVEQGTYDELMKEKELLYSLVKMAEI